MSLFNYIIEDEITCPYCGWRDSDSWEMQWDADEVICDQCGKEFFVERLIEVRYKSTKLNKGK